MSESLFDVTRARLSASRSNVSHRTLVKRAGRWLRKTQRCAAVLLEPGYGSTGEIPDAIGWRTNGRSVLVECKASRSDFLSDKAKPFRTSGGMGAERWYMVPAGMVEPGEVPEGWGLLFFHHRSERVVKIAHPPMGSALDERGLRKERALLIGCLANVQCEANGWYRVDSEHADHNMGRES